MRLEVGSLKVSYQNHIKEMFHQKRDHFQKERLGKDRLQISNHVAEIYVVFVGMY